MGGICSTEKMIAMKERKNRLIETAIILGQCVEKFEDEQLVDLLCSSDIKFENQKQLVPVISFGIATLDQMFPLNYAITLRNENVKPMSLRGKNLNNHYQHLIGNNNSNKTLFIRSSISNSKGEYVDSQISDVEAIKYFIPSPHYPPLNSHIMRNIEFQAGNFLTLNGLHFYPIHFVSKKTGSEIIRFKSDGLVVNLEKHNQSSSLLSSSSTSSSVDKKSEKETDAFVSKDKKFKTDMYLTLDIPVGWSCVAHCYWVNLSIFQS